MSYTTPFPRTFLLLIPLTTLLAACAVDPKPAFHDVDATITARIGHHIQWNQNTSEDAQAAAALRELLAQNLTPDSAVQIALLNNHMLQATFEDIGIAQADLVQAGLLRNPEFAASWRFPDRAPHQTDAEYAVSQNFLDLLIIPLRKKIAAAQLERTKQTVANAVLSLAAEVRIALYSLEADEQLLTSLHLLADINQTAADLAQRQLAAGTINDLDLANQQALNAESQLELTRAQIDLVAAREKLTRLLGLSDIDPPLKIPTELPPLPPTDPDLTNLQTLALQNRLDLAASKATVASLASSLGLSENFRYLTTLKLGVDTEHNPGGPNVTGPTLSLELPLFDQGQARIATLQSQYRRAQQQSLQLALDIRSEVREASSALTSQRTLATTYTTTILPQRQNIPPPHPTPLQRHAQRHLRPPPRQTIRSHRRTRRHPSHPRLLDRPRPTRARRWRPTPHPPSPPPPSPPPETNHDDTTQNDAHHLRTPRRRHRTPPTPALRPRQHAHSRSAARKSTRLSPLRHHPQRLLPPLHHGRRLQNLPPHRGTNQKRIRPRHDRQLLGL